MIPKIIHYCWFGRGDKSKLAEKCIASWKKFCPDYKIIEWNEDNFDIGRHPYLQWCYANKKWAFLSDFVRLLILQEYGGLYFDTDVEVVRNPDDLLQFEAFYGFENHQYINTGQGFGCIPGHVTINAMANEYRSLLPDESGGYAVTACPALNTKALIPLGLKLNGQKQTVCGAVILPMDFLNPYDDPTGRLLKTENTYSIHWYGKSWMDQKIILKSRIIRPLHLIFGTDFILFRLMRKHR